MTRTTRPRVTIPAPHLFLAFAFGIALWAALILAVFVVLRPGL